MYNLNDLYRQVDYAGNKIVYTGYLVCRTCDDELQQQKLPRPLPPDPQPVRNPRVQNADMGPEPPVQSVRDILGL